MIFLKAITVTVLAFFCMAFSLGDAWAQEESDAEILERLEKLEEDNKNQAKKIADLEAGREKDKKKIADLGAKFDEQEAKEKEKSFAETVSNTVGAVVTGVTKNPAAGAIAKEVTKKAIEKVVLAKCGGPCKRRIGYSKHQRYCDKHTKYWWA